MSRQERKLTPDRSALHRFGYELQEIRKARRLSQDRLGKLAHATPAVDKVRAELDGLATVIDGGDPVDLGAMLDDLGERGIRRLIVEGGGTIHTQFLTHNLADEIHLAWRRFVGDATAPQFVQPGHFPQDVAYRMAVEEVRQIGDVVLARYIAKPGPA